VDTPPPDGPGAAKRIGEYVFGVLVVGLGIFTIVDTGTISVRNSANTLGPRAFPYAVGALLVATGIAVLIATLRGKFGEEEESEDVDANVKTDWLTVLKLVVFLVAHILLLDVLGWLIAAAILFAGAAWSLGARPWWKPVVVGVVLALVVQVAFGAGLGLSLPAGILEGVPLIDG
jgi:putative tricarboxylic transport membrane protein